MLACISFIAFDWISSKERMVSNIQALAGVVADNSTSALSFLDSAAAEETLLTLRVERQLVSACIYQADGQVFATYHRDGGTEGERVYFYDFETKDEQWGLSVEEWGSKQDGFEYQAYVSEYLPADAVEVLVVGDA